MKKVYKIKVNEKVYEIELEEVKTVDGHVEVPATKVAAPAPVAQVQATPIQATPVVASTGEVIEAPMPGVIIDIKVKVGDVINEGDLVAIIEAMKMETELYADKGGKVSVINAGKGTQINAGDAIITL